MLGLRQKDLAERTGLALNSISRIELGHVTPSTQSLETIAEALGCSVSELYPRLEPSPRSIGEALFRAGVRDRTLSLSLPEIRDLFRTPQGGVIGYDEAYEIARNVLDAMAALKRELSFYGMDFQSVNMQRIASDRTSLAVLEYKAISQEALDHARESRDGELYERIFKESSDVVTRMHDERW